MVCFLDFKLSVLSVSHRYFSAASSASTNVFRLFRQGSSSLYQRYPWVSLMKYQRYPWMDGPNPGCYINLLLFVNREMAMLSKWWWRWWQNQERERYGRLGLRWNIVRSVESFPGEPHIWQDGQRAYFLCCQPSKILQKSCKKRRMSDFHFWFPFWHFQLFWFLRSPFATTNHLSCINHICWSSFHN